MRSLRKTEADSYVVNTAIRDLQTTVDGLVVASGVTDPLNNDLDAAGFSFGTVGSQASDLFLEEGGTINWDAGDVVLTQTGNTLALSGGGFILPAGTTANAPLTVVAGSNLTAAVTGSFEFDGANLFFTPSSDRQTVTTGGCFAAAGMEMA